MRPASRLLLVALCCLAPLACQGQTPSTPTAFSERIGALSEPGGYFDTDNLISNETSYLHAISVLRAHDVTGGAYLGVGPAQNFSYIAAIRPEVALILDIRRDNMLHHLLFKALFAEARDRLDYLCLLTGRAYPSGAQHVDTWTIQQLVDAVDTAAPDAAMTARVQAALERIGFPLDDADHAILNRLHGPFLDDGLSLRFNSFGRAPQPYYPTLRQLLLATDLEGNQVNYLARADDFQFLKTMQAEDRLIPLVGDLGGTQALAAVGAFLKEQNLTVSAFYTSNVEYYLMRQGTFNRFAETVATLPFDERSVLIRSYFHRFNRSHPQTQPGHASTQLVQPIARLVSTHAARGYTTYQALMNDGVLEASAHVSTN